MSDSPPPSGPTSHEVEALVVRAIADRVDPLRAQLVTVGRGLGVLADRVPRPQVLDDLTSRLDTLTARVEELTALERALRDGLSEIGTKLSETTAAGLAEARNELSGRLNGVAGQVVRSVAREAEARQESVADLRQAIATAVEDAVARTERARAADTERLLERVAALDSPLQRDAEERRSQAVDLSRVVEEALSRVDARRTVDTERLEARLAGLEEPLQRDAEERRSQFDELRRVLAVAVNHAVAKVEQARTAETERLLERIEAVSSEAEARRAEAQEFRQTMATALEQAVAWIEGAVTTDTGRVLERLAALEAPLAAGVEARHADAEARQAEVEDLRAAIAATVEQAVGRIEAAHVADVDRIAEQVAALAEPLNREADGRAAQTDELRTIVVATLEAALAQTEVARAADATRILEQVTALEGPLTRDAIARQAQLDDLRHTVATTIDQAVTRIESARAAESARVVEQVTALLERTEADAQRRDEQAAALLSAVDDRLQALHTAGVEAGEAREERLVSRLERITADHGSSLLAHLDERTAAIKDLESIPPRVATEVQAATASALTSQVEPLIARLVEACDNLAHEGGRIEAMARAQAGEARAVEERVAGLFIEVAERAESAVDHSRARIAEGQVALSTRFDALVGELMTAISAAGDRLDGRVIETAEGLRAASGHQNGALLDAVTRSSQQLGEGLAEMRATLVASGTEAAALGAEAEQRAESLAERLDALRATVESIRHDPRLEALVVEQVGAREAQLTAIEAVSARIDEVGPVVARALLSEVERATRAANAAEEAVAALRPEALRSALGDAAEEIRSAASQMGETIAGLTEEVGQGLAAIGESQADIRAKLAELQKPTDEASLARVDQLDRSLSEALSALGATVATSQEELQTLITRALEHSAALANEVAEVSGSALDDLRASQTVLRQAVQEGAHKAELAALDIRGLRERLTPHLVALSEATTRRADADQAGFDAVLARLDQLLAALPR